MNWKQQLARIILWVGLAIFSLWMVLRNDKGSWKGRLAFSLMMILVMPMVVWMVVLPPRIALWYMVLLTPTVIALALYHSRHG